MIPTEEDNPKGLHQRYIISRVDGKPIKPEAEYFILRLDEHAKNKAHTNACRKAVLIYAKEIESQLPELAADLIARYSTTVGDDI